MPELTDNDLRALVHPASGRIEKADSRVRGLVLRVTSTGSKTWCLRTRTHDGRETRPKLGTYPAMSLAEARKAANAMLVAVQSGKDPVKEKQATRAARKAAQAEATVAVRLAEWQTAHISDRVRPWSPRYAVETARVVKRDIPPRLLNKPLTATTRADWTALVAQKRQTPAAAANLYRAISAFLNHAEACGWISVPLLPRKGAAMLAPAVASRERVLSDAELAAVWRAANREAPRARAFARLLILTAGRESEVAGIAVAEVDMKARRWAIPATRSKNGQPLTVPLCDLALAELQAIWPGATERHGPNWRLLGKSGVNPFSGFSKLKERVDAGSGVEGWRWHDLRRTARTGMTRLGVTRDHAEAAINHISGRSALERTYDRHDYAAEVIDALAVWQAHVTTLVKRGDG